MPINSVAVFCGSSSQVNGKYLRAAGDLGRAFAGAGWTTVYGGGGVGLMGALAEATLNAKGTVVGVRPTFISDLEGDQMGLTEMIITQTMHERMAIIFDKSDAFVALPGSCGTLDEVMQAVTWKRLGLHNKAVVILDQDGYFRPLLDMFGQMVEQRFVVPAFRGLYAVRADVAGVIEYLHSYQPPAQEPL